MQSQKLHEADLDTPADIESESCSICLQSFVLPVKLQCSHQFCFLCIKGVAMRTGLCALCRAPIPMSFLTAAQTASADSADSMLTSENRLWYYEGYKGWWAYDHRTALDLEALYQSGCRSKQESHELLIAGFMYTVDLDRMIQFRSTAAGRVRKIKRIASTESISEIKGVGGLKAPEGLTFVGSSTVKSNVDQQLDSGCLVTDKRLSAVGNSDPGVCSTTDSSGEYQLSSSSSSFNNSHVCSCDEASYPRVSRDSSTSDGLRHRKCIAPNSDYDNSVMRSTDSSVRPKCSLHRCPDAGPSLLIESEVDENPALSSPALSSKTLQIDTLLQSTSDTPDVQSLVDDMQHFHV